MIDLSTLADRAEALLRASDAIHRPLGVGATVTRHQTASGGELAVATRTRPSDEVAISLSFEFFSTLNGVRCVAVISDDDGRLVASLGDFSLEDPRVIEPWLAATVEIGWSILAESTDPRVPTAPRKD
jgi:hypothetical protein